MTWNYKWTEINERLYAYIRYRLEDTLDGFQKPYTEVLAYVHDKGERGSWEWHAYRHVADQVEEMDISSSLLLIIQNEVAILLGSGDGGKIFLQ